MPAAPPKLGEWTKSGASADYYSPFSGGGGGNQLDKGMSNFRHWRNIKQSSMRLTVCGETTTDSLPDAVCERSDLPARHGRAGPTTTLCGHERLGAICKTAVDSCMQWSHSVTCRSTRTLAASNRSNQRRYDMVFQNCKESPSPQAPSSHLWPHRALWLQKQSACSKAVFTVNVWPCRLEMLVESKQGHPRCNVDLCVRLQRYWRSASQFVN